MTPQSGAISTYFVRELWQHSVDRSAIKPYHKYHSELSKLIVFSCNFISAETPATTRSARTRVAPQGGPLRHDKIDDEKRDPRQTIAVKGASGQAEQAEMIEQRGRDDLREQNEVYEVAGTEAGDEDRR